MDQFSVCLEGLHDPIVYANGNLHLERSALLELDQFRQIEGIQSLCCTPDFHRGAGTPIGTVALMDRVYPKVVGNDIGCGMRLDVLGLHDLEVTDELIGKLRHAFFEGGREVLVRNRHDVLAYGTLCDLKGRSTRAIPKGSNTYGAGALGDCEVSDVLQAYRDLSSPRDNFLGSVGGGNHFVELQIVDEIADAVAAFAMGLRRGSICVMVHSGSLDLGHQVAGHFCDLAKSVWTGKHPASGYFPLTGYAARDYVTASCNAANFAMVNRSVMAGMVADVLDCGLKSVYDAPHNFVVEHDEQFLHRKGACPADEGEPVIIPGSMGTRSFLGLGQAFNGTLNSAPHGAGRTLSRNAARATSSDLDQIRLITKVDPSRVRPDVANEIMQQIAEEAPRSYKDIGEVVATSVGAGIVKPVAWLKPLATIKG